MEDAGWWRNMGEALQVAGAVLAGLRSTQTRRAYRRDLDCWLAFCAAHQLHPFRGVRRTRSRGWTTGMLTDLLAAAEDEGGDPYALAWLLGPNGLRVSEACGTDIADLGGSRYQPTLRILGKGDKPAEVVLNPRTQQAVQQSVAGRSAGPLLRNQWKRRMRPHNAAAILRRLAGNAGIIQRVTPHARRRSYITVGLLQGVPLREMQRAARHAKADTTVAYDQSERFLPQGPHLRPDGRHRPLIAADPRRL